MSDSGLGDGGQGAVVPEAPVVASSASTATALDSNPLYPVTAGFDAPLKIARWRAIGNYILGIPHIVVLWVLLLASNVVAFAAWFVVLFTGRMPEGMGHFIAGVHRYQWRVTSYILFLREEYPAFSIPSGYADPGDDPAWVQISPPEHYNRLTVFFRFILVIPLALVGLVYFIGLYFAWVAAFFVVLVTGRWQEGIRRYIVGIEFWAIRVSAWYSLLADPYPPFLYG